MAGPYDRPIATAMRMIAKYGAAVYWQKPVTTIPDAQKPWDVVAGTPLQYGVSIAFFPYGMNDSGTTKQGRSVQGFDAQSAPDVQIGEETGLMGPYSDFTPSVDDCVIRGTDVLRIAAIDKIAPAGYPVVYVIYFAL